MTPASSHTTHIYPPASICPHLLSSHSSSVKLRGTLLAPMENQFLHLLTHVTPTILPSPASSGSLSLYWVIPINKYAVMYPMYGRLPKDVHILIPEPVTMLGYITEELRMKLRLLTS